MQKKKKKILQTTSRQLISALKKTSIYTGIIKRNPMILKSMDRVTLTKTKVAQFKIIPMSKSSMPEKSSDFSGINKSADNLSALKLRNRPETVLSAHKTINVLNKIQQNQKRQRKIEELSRIINEEQNLYQNSFYNV